MKTLKILIVLFLCFISHNTASAAIVKGFLTTSTVQTDINGDLTLSHQQDSGADGLLIVAFSLPSAVNITTVTYNSVTLTLMQSITISSVTYRSYYLTGPSTGAHDLLINTDTAFSTMRTAAQSFTGTILGTNQVATTGASPVNDSITVSTDSMIYMIGMYSATSANTPTLVANSVTLTKDYQLQFIYTFAGALSAAQTAGAKSVSCSFPSGTGNIFTIELELAGGGGPAPRRVIIF